MATESTEFVIPASLALGKIKSTFKQKLNCIEQPAEQLEISCLDSFDWRLYKKGVSVEAIEQGNHTQLSLCKLNSRDSQCMETVKGEVDLAWNLPDGPLKKQISKKLKMRALIPQVYLYVKRYYLAGLNKDQKTVSRIILEEYQVYDLDADRYKRLEKRLQVIPVRGYPNPHRRVLDFIQREWNLEQSSQDVLVSALDVLSRKPADYSAKSHITLTPEMRTDVATKALLREMLEVMEANEWGICEDIDSEFLHDYRVAIRKTRSAFKQIKEIFPQHALDKYQKDFLWLGSVTSPARDMDVYLLKFDDYRKMLPTELQQHIGPLHKLLEKKKRSAYAALVRALNSKRYQSFLNSYHEFLDAPPSEDSSEVNAQRPVQAVANERIWKTYKRVMKEGKAINEDSPAEDLHELRITCKKLRYLIEFFQSLYDPKEIKQLINAMKNLQDNLGEYNDLHVQAEKLTEFSVELQKQKSLSKETRNAMDMLVEHLKELQVKERTNFSERFEKFSNKMVKRQFKHLFKPGHKISEVV